MSYQPQTFLLNKVENETKSSKGRVLVAMSGGVDSSTTVALLMEQGDDNVRITM